MSRFCLGMGMARGEGVAMEVGQEAAWPLAERSLCSVARPRLRAACLLASRSRTRGLESWTRGSRLCGGGRLVECGSGKREGVR